MLNYDKITEELLRREYLDNNKSWRQIAKELGVSDVLLIYHANKYNIKSRNISEARSLINNLPKDEIAESYANGLSINSLSKQYNVSYSVMRNFIKTNGIVLRNSSLARSIKKDGIARWKWEQYDWLKSAYDVFSINMIAKYVGWSYSRVRRSLMELNIELKENKGPNNTNNEEFPPLVDIDIEQFRLDIETYTLSEIANKYRMLENSIIDLCTDLSIQFTTTPIVRTGPSDESLSKASLKKWSETSFVEKVTISNINKYSDTEYASHIASRRLQQRDKVSSIQQLLYDVLDDINIKYYKESSDTLFGYYSFDCLIPNYHGGYSLLIEVQGDYWHKLERVKNNDRKKFRFMKEYFNNYHIMYIWEHEFNNLENIKDKILSKCGLINYGNYDFDQLSIREITYDEAKILLDTYHYLGAARGGIAYGAWLNDELVACALFSSPIRQNIRNKNDANNIIEISRVCVNPKYRKKNLVSWFISRAMRCVDADMFVAYSDSTVGHLGTIYKALNFRLDHKIDPDYWYIGIDNTILHKKTLYNRAKQLNMTESEYANKFDYYKQYGGEKLCFTFKK